MTNKPSVLTAGHSINATAGDSMFIQSSNLTASDAINLSAHTLLFGAAKDVDYLSIQSTKDNGIMTTMVNQGHHIETVKQTKLQANAVNLNATSFAVQYEGQEGENLSQPLTVSNNNTAWNGWDNSNNKRT
ncbi:MAG: hypothetical protein IPP74_03215 [Alphaproteobacteria bacterium]|nr:hypothetical protein [Alphaproteobacteria bacterium]